MNCPSSQWIGFPGGNAENYADDIHTAHICIIPYKQQAACCDGLLTKVRTKLANEVASLGVQVWTIGHQ